MRVCLVNPPVFEVIEPAYGQPRFIRLAIAAIAGYLRSKYIDIHVLDCEFDRFGLPTKP
tara:strand:+ start:325 stop:501 length:177 start_codon:yes stop_codon:yes gene_type:complete